MSSPLPRGGRCWDRAGAQEEFPEQEVGPAKESRRKLDFPGICVYSSWVQFAPGAGSLCSVGISDVLSGAGFLGLCTADIWGQVLSRSGDRPGLVGCSAPFLPLSTRSQEHPAPSSCGNPRVSRWAKCPLQGRLAPGQDHAPEKGFWSYNMRGLLEISKICYVCALALGRRPTTPLLSPSQSQCPAESRTIAPEFPSCS